MEKITTEELKKIQIEILNAVDEFCKKNEIKYFLNCGTLLGAVRHKGYIPWDDDIDLGMLRKDYDKFINGFNEFSDRFKAYSIENNPKTLYPFIKVLDTKTVLYEPDEKGVKTCVNIDVFVYDDAPDSEKVLRKAYKKRDRLITLNNIRTKLYFSPDSILKKTIKKIIYPFLLVFPKNYFTKKIVKNAKKFNNSDANKVANFMGQTKICVDKQIFEEFTQVEFEGENYPSPKNYDLWLKTFYGDYMSLPPIEKRVGHHNFIAYKK